MRAIRFVPLLIFFNLNLQTADSVLEINQACTLNGGCFAGDAAGFPVTINVNADFVPTKIRIVDIDAPHSREPSTILSEEYLESGSDHLTS